MLAGAALAVSGLQMQTLFRNPLADPFVLGISAGASLGVAIVVLTAGAGGSALIAGLGFLGDLGLAVAAILGAAVVLGCVLLVSRSVSSVMTLLILGLMFGYATAALRQHSDLLQRSRTDPVVYPVDVWQFRQRDVAPGPRARRRHSSWPRARVAVYQAPERTAAGRELRPQHGPERETRAAVDPCQRVGSRGRHHRLLRPIAFLGLAVPHLCRSLLHTSDHRVLMPAVICLGATLALLSDLFAHLPGSQYVLPLNAVTSLIGAPVVIWFILHRKNLNQTI